MADWHPLLAARQIVPGQWYVMDGLRKPNGRIPFVRSGDQGGYRADRCNENGTPTVLVGYCRSLVAATSAAAAAHSAFIRSHGATGAPIVTGIIQGRGFDQTAAR